MRLSRKYFAGGVNGHLFNAIISTAVTNYDLRAAAVAAGWDQIKPLFATVSITSTGVVYSNSTSAAFLISGAFPANTTIDVALASGAAIYGGSGGGGVGGVSAGTSAGLASNGSPGGAAFSTTRAVTVNNLGTIGGGGGGGGGGGAKTQVKSGFSTAFGSGGNGGNGAGYGSPAVAGNPGEYSNPAGGHVAQGGDGGAGGGFGAPGAAGTNGYGYGGDSAASTDGRPGGPGGNCTVGNSFITWTNTGTRLGGLA